MSDKKAPLTGVGLGLRPCLMDDLKQASQSPVNFLEIAPENWMAVGGKRAKNLQYFSGQFPLVCHGLSLSLGSPAPLNETFLAEVKIFLDRFNIAYYSDHLSFCSDDGYLYDLLPIPYTEASADYVASRVRRAQEILERRIAIENVSCYCEPGAEMSEIEFVNRVLEQADCNLLLDVNNIYVNSVNHKFDPQEYLSKIPGERVTYIHIAGHYQETPELLVDTHGENIVSPVWDLLAQAYAQFGPVPTLLERDFNIPPLAELMVEVDHITALQAKVESKAEGLVTNDS